MSPRHAGWRHRRATYPFAGRTRMSERRPPLAVALHYSGRGAPRVVAKGGGDIAERIIETAREHKDRKSTRLNSSHVKISYAVFCLKKKKKQTYARRQKRSNAIA